ncbi:MAG: nitrate reductase subunit beta [Desulfobacterales bacterium]|nr:nitrate reductase subunit beta [Desulfobacterales bacterium]
MKIKAQMTMVLNLDKCIGCHTCSIPCKNVWTSRAGAEYMWFNNVETKPGIGYPKNWEDQGIYQGGWTAENNRLSLAAGGRVQKLARIFNNPDLPQIDAYYEPWDYDCGRLVTSPEKKHQPAIRPRSQITGQSMEIQWGPNWEDDLAGVCETGTADTNFAGLDAQKYLEFEQAFMMYLPRLCEHCLNPACAASCPSGALYKRDEDGIVLVDQARCRGWRYCVSGCPYKKVYFNWKTGTSEKCIFCYPRTESGMTTLCSASCVGRIRYVGVILYDAERISRAASPADPKDIYPALVDMMLDPHDPKVLNVAEKQGISQGFLAAAQNSPTDKLMRKWPLALPLHPEYRTLPMVWYVPPLSPLQTGTENKNPDEALSDMRIPVKYLANLLAAGDEAPVRRSLKYLMALRAYMRSSRLEKTPDKSILEQAGLDEKLDAQTVLEIYDLLAIAKHKDRFVIPTAPNPDQADMRAAQGEKGFE